MEGYCDDGLLFSQGTDMSLQGDISNGKTEMNATPRTLGALQFCCEIPSGLCNPGDHSPRISSHVVHREGSPAGGGPWQAQGCRLLGILCAGWGWRRPSPAGGQQRIFSPLLFSGPPFPPPPSHLPSPPFLYLFSTNLIFRLRLACGG